MFWLPALTFKWRIVQYYLFTTPVAHLYSVGPSSCLFIGAHEFKDTPLAYVKPHQFKVSLNKRMRTEFVTGNCLLPIHHFKVQLFWIRTAVVAQGLQWLGYGPSNWWIADRGSFPGSGKRFFSSPKRPGWLWVLPSRLSMGTVTWRRPLATIYCWDWEWVRYTFYPE